MESHSESQTIKEEPLDIEDIFEDEHENDESVANAENVEIKKEKPEINSEPSIDFANLKWGKLSNMTTWLTFCQFSMKTNGFTENDFMKFFEMVFESRGKKIKPLIYTNIRTKLEAMYQFHEGKNLDEAFPVIKDFVMKKIKKTFNESNDDENGVKKKRGRPPSKKKTEVKLEQKNDDDELKQKPKRGRPPGPIKTHEPKVPRMSLDEDVKETKASKSSIHAWEKFCNFVRKADEFTEEDFISYFESLFKKSLKNVNAKPPMFDDIFNKLSVVYQDNFERDLSEDFPNVNDFIQLKMLERNGGLNDTVVWSMFCQYSQKTSNFTEIDVIEFLRICFQKI